MKQGATRTVFLIGGYAVKIPRLLSWSHFLWGLLANMQEADFWTMKHEKLCPVLFSAWGGFFLVMPKAEELPQSEYDALDVEAWRQCESWSIPVEDKKSSFGIYNGRIVAVDYGS